VAGQTHELGPHWVIVRAAWGQDEWHQAVQQQQQQEQQQQQQPPGPRSEGAETHSEVQLVALAAEAALNELLQAARLGGGGQVNSYPLLVCQNVCLCIHF